TIRSRTGATLYHHHLFFPGLGAPIAFLFALGLVDKVRERLRRETPRARLRRARGRARRRIRAAEAHIKMNRPASFYGEIARVIAEHIEERLGVSTAGMTQERLGELLGARGFPPALVAEITRELEACDFARFAPTAPGAVEMRSAIRRTH